jgi:hypothetical protein
MSITCPLGKIERTGYQYNKKGKTVNVVPTCVSDKGKPGKGPKEVKASLRVKEVKPPQGPKLIVIPKYDIGLLSDYGYSLHSSYDDRVKAIKKSLKAHDKLKILRHINALRTLQKSNEKYYNKLSKDLKWIQSHYDKI